MVCWMITIIGNWRLVRDFFYSHKAGNQKGHANQTWCLLFSNISII